MPCDCSVVWCQRRHCDGKPPLQLGGLGSAGYARDVRVQRLVCTSMRRYARVCAGTRNAPVYVEYARVAPGGDARVCVSNTHTLI